MFDAAQTVLPVGLTDGDLADLRQQMLQFAAARLHDVHLAEDVVQEALMGAFVNAQQFAERSALRTWMFGILKHKIADAQRRQDRLVKTAELEAFDHSAVDDGWLARHPLGTAAQANPHKMAESAQFARVLTGCMGDLSPQQAQVFGLRELNDLDPADISQARGIGLSYVHVLLHRAKAKLRHCLEHHWLGRKA
ncbi:MAG: sigma-70 family RNA polymerase sigma factor [Marinagarivorans sp.]